jgi:hypothetical protein
VHSRLYEVPWSRNRRRSADSIPEVISLERACLPMAGRVGGSSHSWLSLNAPPLRITTDCQLPPPVCRRVSCPGKQIHIHTRSQTSSRSSAGPLLPRALFLLRVVPWCSGAASPASPVAALCCACACPHHGQLHPVPRSDCTGTVNRSVTPTHAQDHPGGVPSRAALAKRRGIAAHPTGGHRAPAPRPDLPVP